MSTVSIKVIMLIALSMSTLHNMYLSFSVSIQPWNLKILTSIPLISLISEVLQLPFVQLLHSEVFSNIQLLQISSIILTVLCLKDSILMTPQ